MRHFEADVSAEVTNDGAITLTFGEDHVLTGVFVASTSDDELIHYIAKDSNGNVVSEGVCLHVLKIMCTMLSI